MPRRLSRRLRERSESDEPHGWKEGDQPVIGWKEWMLYSRFDPVRRFAWNALNKDLDCMPAMPREPRVKLLVGGDVCFDGTCRGAPYLGVDRVGGKSREAGALSNVRRKLRRAMAKAMLSDRYFSNSVDLPLPRLRVKLGNGGERRFLKEYFKDRIFFDQEYPCDKSDPSFPFARLTTLFSEMDLVFVNLETPLSARKRAQGYFISDPAYARAMKDAGIGMVGMANNHVFDAGEPGFLETLEHLSAAGILQTGAGLSMAEARAGRTVTVNGRTLHFLAYTQFCSQRYSSIAGDYPGILPLDPKLMADDVRKARASADLVLVSLHWGQENVPNVHPEQREIAHKLIEAGADCIIGHHPHVPQAIEVHRDRPIIYSLGNFIFGNSPRNGTHTDNLLVELHVGERRIDGLVLHPIAGQRFEMFQPYPLEGQRARRLIEDMQIKCFKYGTRVAEKGGKGFISIHSADKKGEAGHAHRQDRQLC
jgi:poly-gamma-glutamate capsule biosynthesis protein CapA/YwtB (metallophosphatase superfamily)